MWWMWMKIFQEIRKLFQQSFDNFEGTFSWSDLMLLLIPVLMASLILCCISWANNTQLEHQVIALLTTKRQLTSDSMTTDVSDSWWQRPPFCSLARPVQHYATSVLCKTLQNSANRCSTKLWKIVQTKFSAKQWKTMETDAVHYRTEEHYTNFVECFTSLQSAKPTFESSIGKWRMGHTHVKISQH